MGLDIQYLNLTKPEFILLGAYLLEENHKVAQVTLADLIVTSWGINAFSQEGLGLKGYLNQYPDSNKVISNLSGESGLVKQGYLEKVQANTYKLTWKGKKRIDDFLQQPEEKIVPTYLSVTPEQAAWLGRVFDSIAFQKWGQKRVPEILFLDACAFWDANPLSTMADFQTCKERFNKTLHDIKAIAKTGDIQLESGQIINAEEVHIVAKINLYLEDHFKSRLILMKMKTQQNGRH